jgi:hypothetical protein
LLDILKADPVSLLDARLLDPDATDRFLNAFGVPASTWVSTDDNLFLEYSTPKGNARDGTESFNSNTQFIVRHSMARPDSLAARTDQPGRGLPE